MIRRPNGCFYENEQNEIHQDVAMLTSVHLHVDPLMMIPDEQV